MLAIQLSRARQRSIRPDDGVMGASFGNRRIALALVALVGSVVALHVHAVRVHGIQPTRTTGGPARSTPSGLKRQAGQDANQGTQNSRLNRINRLTLGR